MGTGATHMQDDPEWRNDAWDVINRGEVQVAPQEVQVPKVICKPEVPVRTPARICLFSFFSHLGA